MMYNLSIIKKKIGSALSLFITKDEKLLEINSNERNISQTFSYYIKEEFPDWDVDCDYNRYMKEVKKLERNGKEEIIYPDIIIHKRVSENNLLIIEMKKSPPYSLSNQLVKEDLDKLRTMTSDDKYHYRFGLFILFNIKEKRKKPPILKYYQNGEVV